MAYEQKNMTGILFRNDKRTSDKHPTHRGSITIGGVEYFLSAWVKEGKKGKFFSLAAQPKRTSEPSEPPQPPSEDDIPF